MHCYCILSIHWVSDFNYSIYYEIKGLKCSFKKREISNVKNENVHVYEQLKKSKEKRMNKSVQMINKICVWSMLWFAAIAQTVAP